MGVVVNRVNKTTLQLTLAIGRCLVPSEINIVALWQDGESRMNDAKDAWTTSTWRRMKTYMSGFPAEKKKLTYLHASSVVSLPLHYSSMDVRLRESRQ
eukprot:m.69757 g.69757  ORF g.69757 m.69757 type:complete len:98 (+) comp12086_c0_seq6:1235-1528(+)